jgi:hypothetical protein
MKLVDLSRKRNGKCLYLNDGHTRLLLRQLDMRAYVKKFTKVLGIN